MIRARRLLDELRAAGHEVDTVFRRLEAGPGSAIERSSNGLSAARRIRQKLDARKASFWSTLALS
jgi:hypothetical protein